MKIKYSPNGPGKKPAPKTWEVWLADAPFGPGGKSKRCPVAVGKRTSAGWTVYEIIPSGERGGRDAVISDLIKAEDAASPLSDGRMAAILKSKGISIARRTVAKYRIELGIPGAIERRLKA